MASNWLSFEDTPAGLPTMALGVIVAMLPLCIAFCLALIAELIDEDGSGLAHQISHVSFWLSSILSILTIPTGAFFALSGLVIFIRSRKSR